jgi:hypothetical protein
MTAILREPAHGGSSALHGDGPPVNGVNAIWDVNADVTPMTGDYKIRFRGETSGPIPFDATATEAAAIIAAISTIGAGNMQPEPDSATNTLVNQGSLYLMFIGDLAVQDIEPFEIVDDTTDGALSVGDDQIGSPPSPVGVLGAQYLDDLHGIEYTYTTRQEAHGVNDGLFYDPTGWVPTGPPGVVFLFDPDGNLRGVLHLEGGEIRLRHFTADGAERAEVFLGDAQVSVLLNGPDPIGNRRFDFDQLGVNFAATNAAGDTGMTARVKDDRVEWTSTVAFTPTSTVELWGTADPSAGAGVFAANGGGVGSTYHKVDDGTDWKKTGPADTDWRQLAFVP